MNQENIVKTLGTTTLIKEYFLTKERAIKVFESSRYYTDIKKHAYHVNFLRKKMDAIAKEIRLLTISKAYDEFFNKGLQK